MTKILIFLLILISGCVFSQNANGKETKVTLVNLKKSNSIKELLTIIPTDYEVIYAEYAFSVKGKICIEVTNGNDIPKTIKNNSFKKGDAMYIDMKLSQDKTVKDPKIMSMTTKIIIE